MTAAIVMDRLTRNYGALRAVDNVSMSIEAGEVLGFLGPNGAGKTTTMRMVAGFLNPSAGTARVCGIDVRDDPVGVRRQIGFLPEGAPIYGEMTTGAYLGFVASVRGFSGAERRRRIRRVVETVSLGEVLGQRIETLSKGFRRRVGLAQTLLHDPPVLILDEPTDGLDPNQKRHVRSLIRSMARDKAIIISTHILEEVDAVCSRAGIIARGRLVADATPAEIKAMASNHNAVLALIPEGLLPRLETAAAGGEIAEVERVSIVERGEKTVQVRLVPRRGCDIAATAIGWLEAQGVFATDITVEQGSLEAVFHEITGATGPNRQNESIGPSGRDGNG